MANKAPSLAGRLLVAMPSLTDPNFERTVVFICAHSEEGAVGLVINQPHMATMEEVLEQLDVTWLRPEAGMVFLGGPVSLERGFILFERDLGLPGSIQVVPELYMGTNPEMLKRLAQDAIEARFLFALGHAGWAGGQLEAELKENTWLVASLDRQLIFETPPEDRWHVAMARMGIDLGQLVDTSHTVN